MIFFVICLLSFALIQASKWDNVNIAVVEYQPLYNIFLNDEQNVAMNTQNYIEILKNITAETKLDFIIFPEDTLLTNRKTAVEMQLHNPCDLDSYYPQFLKNLSCAARSSETYLAVNLVEKVKCNQSQTHPSENCKEYGFYFYNTDVIFNRNGTIINRYHKYNLFGETTRDKPEIAEEIVIETDFGIKFGIFTCFDILFKAPAQNLLDDSIDAIIYPTMWFSQLPFLTSMQTQQMWSYSHNITLFAAGANNPWLGSGGSGAYRGIEGTAVGGIVAEGGTKVFIYQGDKSKDTEDIDVLAKKMDGFQLKIDHSIQDYEWTPLNTTEKNVQTSVCYNKSEDKNICCEFTLQMSLDKIKPNLNYYKYLLVAYSGIRSFTAVDGGIEVCGIIACLDYSLSSCGQRFPKYEDIQWPLTFENISIKAKFEKNENSTQFPNSLLSSIRPIPTTETMWSESEVKDNGTVFIKRTFSTKKPQNRLMTFAIFGRNFDLDSPNDNYDINLISPVVLFV